MLWLAEGNNISYPYIIFVGTQTKEPGAYMMMIPLLILCISTGYDGKEICSVFALVVATKEIGLEVNADKTKYMIMSRDQNAGRSYRMKIDNSSIERVEEFKYLGTTLTNRNSIQEEIKSRLNLENACYYSVQNLLSSSLLSKS
jgi:hypothetical protein